MKIKSPSSRRLRLKRLWNPALTTTKACSRVLKGKKKTLQRKIITKSNKKKRKVLWVTNRKMGISTKWRIVIDMISRLTLQTESRHCCKKLVKMRSPSLKCLRLKSLSYPALTMKKAHSSILSGNKRKLQRKVIPRKNKWKRKVHWVMKRKMGISTKFSIVVDIIKMLTLQTKIRHCSKKLVKMKSRSPKCLRLKSLSNPTLTMKKAHSSILRGNKRTFQLKMIPKKNKLKRKVHWVMKSKMEISTKCRMVIDMMRRMPLQSKSRQFWKKLIKMKIPSFKCLSLKSPWNPPLTTKNVHSGLLRGNKRKLQRKVIPKKHKSMRKVH